tara:strand:- start:378 stop:611 length:234 start_codon:yes stop_codon:yes gene_type:complete
MKKYIILNTEDHLQAYGGIIEYYKIIPNNFMFSGSFIKNNDGSKFVASFIETPTWVTNEKIYNNEEILEELEKEEWN